MLKDTGDFHRYFDATPHADFLFECVQRTIAHDLPDEAAFRERYELFKTRVEANVEMPHKIVNQMNRILS